jgi:uncharacterized membrane-anchored protein
VRRVLQADSALIGATCPPVGHPLAGPARLGRRTKLLVRRLAPGDVAIIDHAGLDRVSAEELLAAGVRGVLNCSSSLSETYPNVGPLLLLAAGVPLVDLPNDALFEHCLDGDPLELRGGAVRRAGRLVARGRVLTLEEAQAALRERRASVHEALERFVGNTLERMRAERELLSAPLELPRLRTDFRDRPALVVVRGGGYLDDLRALRGYVHGAAPVIVAVDGAVEAVRACGMRADMVVGDMDSASDAALASGAELVAHSYLDGRAPGRDRLVALGLPHAVVRAPGTSEDLALLIAAEAGASLIVSVGSQLNLTELLDRGRAGAASAFLTRLRVAELLVDAKGISRLFANAF